MAFDFALPLRITQFIFAIIVLGLTGYVAHWYNRYTYSASPGQINFLIFDAVWTILAVVYLALTPAYSPRLAHKFAILGLDALTCLFWFAGFIALAVFLSSLLVCTGHVCRSAQAAAVFGAFEWLLFLATTILAALHVWRSRGSSSTKGPANLEVHHNGMHNGV
ncbi:hypothetical protein MMC08_004975 [Hypocenomyce scalaris]|nr:hypothetical protein [Hypocenomyce scalaris]